MTAIARSIKPFYTLSDEEVAENRRLAALIKGLTSPQLLALIEIARVGTFGRGVDGWCGRGSSYHQTTRRTPQAEVRLMFALSAARDLAIAIIATLIFSAVLDGLSRHEARQTPTVHYGVALSPNTRDATVRSSGRLP
jgi:hypothetical protein